MLNEKRVILMTRLASYEQNEGKRCIAIAKYFRADYVAKNVLMGILCATITFFLCFGVYIFYSFEDFMENIYDIDVLAFAQNVFVYYAALVVGYCGIIFLVSTLQYILAKKSLKHYYQNLKKLNALYEEK